MALYREQYRPSVRWPEPVGSIGVFVICAETGAEAERLIKTRDLWSLRQRQGVTAPVPTVEEAEGYTYSPPEAELVRRNRERWVWGTPESVRERLLALGAEYGVEELVVVTICPDFASRLRSYELLAEAFGLTPRAAAAAPGTA